MLREKDKGNYEYAVFAVDIENRRIFLERNV